MDKPARSVAQAARTFERQRTGHAKDPDGAAPLQEFHRHLFATSAASLRADIERISGVKVREAGAEVEPSTGSVVKVFTTGTIVQVFLLADSVETAAWRHDDTAQMQNGRDCGESRLKE
jgi:hypothetical protein